MKQCWDGGLGRGKGSEGEKGTRQAGRIDWRDGMLFLMPGEKKARINIVH